MQARNTSYYCSSRFHRNWQEQKNTKMLLYSGLMNALVRKSVLTKRVKGKLLNESRIMNTFAACMSVDKMIKIRDLRLPDVKVKSLF